MEVLVVEMEKRRGGVENKKARHNGQAFSIF
jgi:hypothetical protein